MFYLVSIFQVKIIKFKHPVHDIQANKNVVVITFLEKLAVFDASTLEDTFTVTTCYPSPGPRYLCSLTKQFRIRKISVTELYELVLAAVPRVNKYAFLF